MDWARNILLVLLILLMPQAIAAEATPSFFALFDVCRNDTVSLTEYGIQTFGQVDSGESTGGDYAAVFVSPENGKILEYKFTATFSAEKTVIDPETGEMKAVEVNLECVEEYFRFPFYENVSKFQIFRNGTLIYEKPLCNNDASCDYELGETKYNCPSDCIKKEDTSSGPDCVDKCGDLICQEAVCMEQGCPCMENGILCPSDCSSPIEEVPEENDSSSSGTPDGEPDANYVSIILVVLLLVIAVAVFLYLRKRSSAKAQGNAQSQENPAQEPQSQESQGQGQYPDY